MNDEVLTSQFDIPCSMTCPTTGGFCGSPIIKPGRLTNDPGTGHVALASKLPKGEIPRADVAAVLAEVLETPELGGYEFDLTAGDTPIQEAVKNALEYRIRQ